MAQSVAKAIVVVNRGKKADAKKQSSKVRRANGKQEIKTES